MTKYFLLLTLIYSNSLSYSQDAELALYYRSYSELEDILTSSGIPTSTLQESSPLPYTPSYDLVDPIQDFLRVSGEKYFSYVSGHPWAQTIQDFVKVSTEKFSVYTTFATMHYVSSFLSFRMKPYYHLITHPYQLLSGDYSQNLSWIVETPYKVERDDWITKLSLDMGKELYGLSLEERIETRARISKKTKEVFYNLHQEKGDRIPHITHRVWVTGTQNPCEPSQKRLEAYIQSLRKLSGTWEHNFWCVDPNGIPKAIQTLKESGFSINIRKLEEISPLMKAKHIFDAYYHSKQFCFASDIARHNIVYLYGGVYADLGVLFLYDLTPYVDAYDCMFTHKIYGHIDIPFFGYKKKNKIIEEYLDTINTLYKLPSAAKDLAKKAWEKQAWTGPSLLMACIDRYSKPEEDRFLFVPEGFDSLITIDHAGSWLGNEKSGNKTTFESELDIFSITP